MGDKSISPEKVPYLWLLLIKKKWNVTEISGKLKIARSCVYTYKKRRISDIHNKKPNKGGRLWWPVVLIEIYHVKLKIESEKNEI